MSLPRLENAIFVSRLNSRKSLGVKLLLVPTPSIVDKVLIGIYRCMAWTKEDQASIASEFPE